LPLRGEENQAAAGEGGTHIPLQKLGNRVMIIGCGGGGKSTLARKLGESTGLPVIHLDKEFWNSGWVETPKAIWYEKQRALAAQERWIIDGNYRGSMEYRLERADTVIFLDFKRTVCLFGVIKRQLTHIGQTRPDMPAGCPEKIDREFIQWIWRFRRETRPGVMAKLEAFPTVRVITLENRQEVRTFLCGLIVR